MNAEKHGETLEVHDLLALEPRPGPTAVAIGVFDGVHLGHQALLKEMCRLAAEAYAIPTVLTFVRHPADVLEGENAPRHISSLEDRVRLLREACPGTVIVARFDHRLAALSPEDFVDRVLIQRLRAKAVVVGPDFRFGKGRSGDAETLRNLASTRGISVVVVPALSAFGGVVSSTRIRNAVAAGDVELAATLLGRRFSLCGPVVQGEGIGRQLGFPTANLDTEPLQLVPKVGVYSAEAEMAGQGYRAAVNIDFRPSLRADSPLVEVHLIGFDGTAYGKTLCVSFERRLRDKINFPDRESLKMRIAADVKEASQPSRSANMFGVRDPTRA